ncbi:transporter substrate-binding domain-containing protein [Thalassotalea sp. M1531]|uniref:histidine kinase n=1 Tax=Thalassotalea algicola TaxID=2716224 RepID=A0A7Y0L9Y6_9GAMM|nr:transporter substrate-binding domain-containing protein [Thalassotalea algicola]NMP30566.1 transporter substrate-binding domain-containing protein [Thalassotalea algicola]
MAAHRKLPHLLSNIFCLFSFISFVIYLFPTSSYAQNNSVDSQENRTLRIALPTTSVAQLDDKEKFDDLIKFLQAYWQIWAIDFQYQIEFQQLATANARQALENNDIDIVAISIIRTPNKNVLFSLPYAKYRQRLFRRIDAEQSGNIKLAIHSSSTQTLNYLGGHIERDYYYDLSDLLNNEQEYDAIYSTQPWALKAQLAQQNLIDKFYENPSETPEVFFHVMTRADDRALMYDINEGLRGVNSIQVKLWRDKYIFDNDSNIDLTLGQYIKNISEEEKQYLIDNNEQSYVALSYGIPPFVITKDFNNIAERGLAIDLLKKVTERTGIIFRPNYIKSESDYFSSVYNQNSDLAPLSTQGEHLLEKLDYSVPYLKARYSLVTRHGSTISNNFSDLKFEAIGLLNGYNDSLILEEMLPNADFKYYNTHEQVLKAVAQGEINAFIGHTLMSSYFIKKLLLANLNSQPMPTFRANSSYRFAVKKHNSQLLNLLNRSISNLTAYEFDALYNKWSQSILLEKDVQVHVKGAYRQAGYILISMALIGLIVAWIYFRQLQIVKTARAKVEQALSIAEAARAEAEKSAQAKITFLARMSHEIRTPMNGVLGMAEELSYTSLNEKQKDLLSTLDGSARNLLALLNDVLDFSKIDAGKLTLETVPVNIKALCQSAIANFKHHEKEKPIKLTLKLDSALNEHYLCDPTRLMQVLNNLVSNAVKFTKKGSVSLSVDVIEQHNRKGDSYHTVKLSVQDSGIGIAKNKQAQLFTPFIQADNAVSRQFGGTGLGLSISQEIINALGGKITLESKEGKGSNFHFTLTLKQIAHLPSKNERRQTNRSEMSANDQRFKSIRILVAEDNIVNVKVLTAQLDRLNIQPDIAEHGEQALQMHRKKPYDIIISDCHMPVMDGFELAKTLTNEKSGRALWLIAVTADALSGSSDKCLAAGFDDYMAKPSTQEEVADKLHHAYRQFMKRRATLVTSTEKNAKYNEPTKSDNT